MLWFLLITDIWGAYYKTAWWNILLCVLETTTAYDPTGRTAYIEGCKKVGVVPASYFLRHMNDPHLSMKHHGLGSQGMRAIAMSLVVCGPWQCHRQRERSKTHFLNPYHLFDTFQNWGNDFITIQWVI